MSSPRGETPSYTPALNRDGISAQLNDQPSPLSPARRQKSLVRPERERMDGTNRQYHYRQHAAQTATAFSTSRQHRHQQQQQQEGGGGGATVTKRYAAARRASNGRLDPLRRSQSILGRDGKLSGLEDEDDKDQGVVGAVERSSVISHNHDRICFCIRSKSCDLWKIYCRLLTCCIPGPVLGCFGIPEGPARMAWREKIGLVSCILLVMGFVGFLTFGFTQTVCPASPSSVPGGSVSQGYLIISGWAYMLADWNSHPPIPGETSDPTNVLYAPINAGGMDASFLFQDINSHVCTDVFRPRRQSSTYSSSLYGSSFADQEQTTNASPVYFPCKMFNPETAEVQNLAISSATAPCHLSQTARNTYASFQANGAPSVKGGYHKASRVYYDWKDIQSKSHLMVYNGDVLDLRLLQLLSPTKYNISSTSLVQQILNDMSAFGSRDMTRYISSTRIHGTNWADEAKCLATLIKVGSLESLSIGCMASEIVLYLSLVVILGVIVTRFGLAVIFGWFLSWRLGNFKESRSYAARMQREAELERWTRDIYTSAPFPPASNRPTSPYSPLAKRRSILPQTSRFTQPLPNSTRFDADRPASTPSWKSPSSALEDFTAPRRSSYMMYTPSPTSSSRNLPATAMSIRRSSISSSDNHSHSGGETITNTTPTCPFPLSPFVIPQPPSSYMPFNYPLTHTICLVTCYSEGYDGIRTTLDSIATSDYPNSHKIILVVCDGLVTGHGESISTPDVCVSMMKDLLVPAEVVEPQSYVAIADGAKRHNMAKVYAGFYDYDDTTVSTEHQQRVPMITVVKCGGTPDEIAKKEAKPGNRGKRDSQIILMQFMQKVLFDERMTTMEYELFNSFWRLTGIPPDKYELMLMVDADTKLFPDALSRLVSCAVKDPEISGLCGETRIANKTASWVSMIQVFEYYISHHQSKAFESIFGGVTCLPGCFCMYRIKAPKGPQGYWVPILANPDVVEHYSENVVDTLHKKNLLLLGEDRYLSTLMLRTFPSRKMMFVPQAVCKTVVPDSFRVLLSQRRRWINSTIHNLMELVLVRDLCGTFCFSMQFVVFMELVGTLALPAAISFTIYLIVLAILGQPAIIPLILLALILGLPAVLIVMTSRKIVYIGWMLIYLFSLPIWNFVLPTYAYWHFDDFSWGDTRKVEGSGDNEKHGHGDKDGEFDSTLITMKRWADFEKERRIKAAIEQNIAPPRFFENVGRNSPMDIYRESVILKSQQQQQQMASDSTVGSSNSSSEALPMLVSQRRSSPAKFSGTPSPPAPPPPARPHPLYQSHSFHGSRAAVAVVAGPKRLSAHCSGTSLSLADDAVQRPQASLSTPTIPTISTSNNNSPRRMYASTRQSQQDR